MRELDLHRSRHVHSTGYQHSMLATRVDGSSRLTAFDDVTKLSLGWAGKSETTRTLPEQMAL
jgi:hypothetical protein